MQFGKYTVELSSQDKTFFPKIDKTKGDLINYYQFVANLIVPHLENRIATLQRFPDGVGSSGFFQKEASDYFPDWLDRIKVDTKGGKIQHTPSVNNQASLIYLVNQGTVTLHRWLSLEKDLNKPDMMVFDLDPAEGGLKQLIEGAQILREMIEEDMGLTTFLLSTGSSGVHLNIPLQGKETFDDVREVAKKMADVISNRKPDMFTTETRKEDRGNRIFLDYLRNAFGQIVVTPYSVRPKEKGPIAVPLAWDDFNSSFDPQAVTLENYTEKIDKDKDAWKGMRRHAVSLKSVNKNIEARSQ